MFPDEIHQSVHRFRFRNVELQRLLAHIQVYLAGSAAHVAKVGVGHFARAIHDATHYRDLHPL